MARDNLVPNACVPDDLSCRFSLDGNDVIVDLIVAALAESSFFFFLKSLIRLAFDSSSDASVGSFLLLESLSSSDDAACSWYRKVRVLPIIKLLLFLRTPPFE